MTASMSLTAGLARWRSVAHLLGALVLSAGLSAGLTGCAAPGGRDGTAQPAEPADVLLVVHRGDHRSPAGFRTNASSHSRDM